MLENVTRDMFAGLFDLQNSCKIMGFLIKGCKAFCQATMCPRVVCRCACCAAAGHHSWSRERPLLMRSRSPVQISGMCACWRWSLSGSWDSAASAALPSTLPSCPSCPSAIRTLREPAHGLQRRMFRAHCPLIDQLRLQAEWIWSTGSTSSDFSSLLC